MPGLESAEMAKSKSITEDGTTYRFSSDWIHRLESEEHWRLYWRQQSLMRNVIQFDNRILEIGVGSGFTADYLRSRGLKVITVDIDEQKKPDIVANIVKFHPATTFDHILAFEVFEHIPFRQFEQVIQNLSPRCSGCFFVSLPQYRWVIAAVEFKLPRLGERRLALTMPKSSLNTAHHHWEIGYGDIDEEDVIDVFARHGFSLRDSNTGFCRTFFAFDRV